MDPRILRKLILIMVILCMWPLAGCGCGVGKHISKAHTHYNKQTKDAPAAIEELQKALKKDPKNIEALTFLGKIQYETKNYDEAVSAYERIIAIVPSDIQSHMNLAKTHKDKGTFDKAIEHLKKVKEINPNGKLAQEADKLIPECESGKLSGGGQQNASAGGDGKNGATKGAGDGKDGKKPQQGKDGQGAQPKKPKPIEF